MTDAADKTTRAEAGPEAVAARRMHALRELAQGATVGAASLEDTLARAAQSLAGADVPLLLFYAMDEEGRHARLVAHAGVAPGLAASPRHVDLAAGRDALPLRRADMSPLDPRAARASVDEVMRWSEEEVGTIPAIGAADIDDAGAPLGPRARVLWADGNADMRTYVARLLGRTYDVEALGDGDAVVAAARERPPDLFLLDVMLPGRDRLALLRELRSLEATRLVPDGLAARGDPRLAMALMENLLGNARKFSSKQPNPRVDVGARALDGDTVFFLRDNGAGFDMEYAHKLFTIFQRLHAATAFPGTGIGLATVHRVVSRHAGRIWAEASPNQGATFFFTLGEHPR